MVSQTYCSLILNKTGNHSNHKIFSFILKVDGEGFKEGGVQECHFYLYSYQDPEQRTQTALPCPCHYSLFQESGATVGHCAVLREVGFNTHSQHSLGFLCQVTTSCVYFLCFLVCVHPNRLF